MRPLAFDEPDSLVQLWPERLWSREMVEIAREDDTAFLEVVGEAFLLLTLQEGDEPTQIFASHVTDDYFDALGTGPTLGRSFSPEDALPGADPTVIVSHDVFIERFGEIRPHLAARCGLVVRERPPRTLIGVMPSGYRSLSGPQIDAWVPVTMDRSDEIYTDSNTMEVYARLAAGVSSWRRAIG